MRYSDKLSPRLSAAFLISRFLDLVHLTGIRSDRTSEASFLGAPRFFFAMIVWFRGVFIVCRIIYSNPCQIKPIFIVCR